MMDDAQVGFEDSAPLNVVLTTHGIWQDGDECGMLIYGCKFQLAMTARYLA